MFLFRDNGITADDKNKIITLLENINDAYSDAYITKNNIRLFIRDNVNILEQCLEQGDRILFSDNSVLVVLGYSDNSPRKYLKILTNDFTDVSVLLHELYNNISNDIYCKLKSHNPLKEVLLSNSFEVVGNRGKEVLLVKKFRG